MFKVGDKICHPMHGAGIIEDIEQKEMFGEMHQFYVIQIPLSKMKLMISTNKAEEMGIRVINDDNEIKKAIDILEGVSTPMPEKWTQRQKYNMQKITSGDIEEVAQVLKNLYDKEVEKGLSTMEKKLESNAKQILISELVISKGIDKDSAESAVNTALLNAYAKK